MKNIILFHITLLLILSIGVSDGLSQEYTQWGLPEGAITRLGKGEIYDIKFSPDGNQLFVGTSIGKWTYDIHSHKEINLLRSHSYSRPTSRDVIAYSPDRKKLQMETLEAALSYWTAKLNGDCTHSRDILTQSVQLPFHQTEAFWQVVVGMQLFACGIHIQENKLEL